MVFEDIKNDVLLGRGVFSQSKAKDAKRGKISYYIYLRRKILLILSQ